MAESAAYSRRGFKGGCAATTVPAGINAGSLTATLTDASTWAGLLTNGNARLMVGRTTATPEEIEMSGLSGNDITISARGLQGTSDTTHAAGVTIEVIHSPRDFNEANYTAAQTVGKATTAGDLLYATAANTLARLGIGTARQVLATNSGATAPEWVASLQSLLTAAGDIIYASSANTPARLAKGTAAQVLTMNSGATAPEWATPSAGAFVGAALTTNATQVVNTGAAAAVAFPTESFDSSTFHDLVTNNSRATVPASLGGKYLVSYTLKWLNGATVTGVIQSYLKVNGTTVTPGELLVRTEELSASNAQTLSTAVVLNLAATDYVEVFFDNASGSNATLQTTCTMQVARIGT